MRETKTLVLMANRIQEALMELKHSRYLEWMNRLTAFTGQTHEFTVETSKMQASLTHGWFSAADRCCTRTNTLLSDISYSISQIQQLSKRPRTDVPKLSVLVDELNQVQYEFGNIDFDKAENRVSVVTEPIILEDVALGPFKIQLDLNKFTEINKDRPYCIIALNPNPAATDDSVTHPHVSGTKLCEGDGSAAISASLEQGRLSDFFTMVRNILSTYNPESPHVSLYDWDGIACYECGYTMSSENTYYCYFCEYDYCSDCSTYCRQCEQTVCLSCSVQCPNCDELVCRNCMSACTDCEESCCASCLEEGLCPSCREKMENENEQEEQITPVHQDRNTDQPETSKTEIELAS